MREEIIYLRWYPYSRYLSVTKVLCCFFQRDCPGAVEMGVRDVTPSPASLLFHVTISKVLPNSKPSPQVCRAQFNCQIIRFRGKPLQRQEAKFSAIGEYDQRILRGSEWWLLNWEEACIIPCSRPSTVNSWSMPQANSFGWQNISYLMTMESLFHLLSS